MLKGDKLYIRKLLLISKLAFALFLLSMIAKTSVLLWQTCRASPSVQPQARAKVQVDKTINSNDISPPDYSEIVKKNPFKLLEPSMNNSNKTWPVHSTVSERLGIALFGTISGKPAISRAIIKNLKNEKLGLYKTGQDIADARIESIYSDSVILVHNGERIILRLNTTPSNNQTNKINTMDLPESASRISNTSAAGSSKTTNNNITQTEIKPAETILGKALIVPYTIDGQVEGLKITNLENIVAAKNIGLKDGDIIYSVNGHKLTGKQKAFQTFKKAMAQEAINLDLLRDGKTKSLSFATR